MTLLLGLGVTVTTVGTGIPTDAVTSEKPPPQSNHGERFPRLHAGNWGRFAAGFHDQPAAPEVLFSVIALL